MNNNSSKEFLLSIRQNLKENECALISTKGQYAIVNKANFEQGMVTPLEIEVAVIAQTKIGQRFRMTCLKKGISFIAHYDINDNNLYLIKL
jgi:hypothetical protein